MIVHNSAHYIKTEVKRESSDKSIFNLIVAII